MCLSSQTNRFRDGGFVIGVAERYNNKRKLTKLVFHIIIEIRKIYIKTKYQVMKDKFRFK